MRYYICLVLVLLVTGCGEEFAAPLFPDVAGAGGEVSASSGGARSEETGGRGGTGTGDAQNVAGTPNDGGVGGDAAAGGSAVGGATGGGAGGVPGTGGSDIGGTTSTGGSACQIITAITKALPPQFTWQSYNSSAVVGSEMACTKCKASPCGAVPISWGQPAQSDPTTFIVPVATAAQCVAGLYGTCGAIVNNCTLCLSVSSAVVTLKLATSGDGYLVQGATVSGAWTITGPYTNDATATTAANSGLTAALNGLNIPCN